VCSSISDKIEQMNRMAMCCKKRTCKACEDWHMPNDGDMVQLPLTGEDDDLPKSGAPRRGLHSAGEEDESDSRVDSPDRRRARST
jgi:hypothetical protein